MGTLAEELLKLKYRHLYQPCYPVFLIIRFEPPKQYKRCKKEKEKL